jgi:hypothetical protein
MTLTIHRAMGVTGLLRPSQYEDSMYDITLTNKVISKTYPITHLDEIGTAMAMFSAAWRDYVRKIPKKVHIDCYDVNLN